MEDESVIFALLVASLAASLSSSVSGVWDRNARECPSEHRTLKLLAFGLLLYSVSSLIHFLHPFLSLRSPVPLLTLPIFHSIHPCSAGVSLHENNHGLCVCVCVDEREGETERKAGEIMGLYHVQ